MFEKFKKFFVKKEEVDIKTLTKAEIRALNRRNPQNIKSMKYKKPTQKLSKNMKTVLKKSKKGGF